MWVLYATEEEMMLAQCELIYLRNLVSFFQHAHYFKCSDDVFLQLSEFYLQMDKKMKGLESLFEDNRSLFTKGQEIELLEMIYSECHKIRDCFQAAHKPFLIAIDELIQNKLTKDNLLIQSTLEIAEKSMNAIDNDKDKSDLGELVDTLKLSTQSLLIPLNTMRRSIIQLSITHETTDMTLALLDTRLKLIDRFYATNLTTLHFQIITKLDTLLSKKQHVQLTCDAINLITKPYIHTNMLFCDMDLIDKQHQKEIKSAVEFIEEHMRFFYAPFHPKTQRLFTRWGNANAKELKEVSDGLRKHLKSHHAIEHFSEALFSLKEGDDDSSLRKILDKNTGLLAFITDCIAYPYPIINKWDRDRKYNSAVNEWDRYYSVYK